jgi:hypothetical protein
MLAPLRLATLLVVVALVAAGCRKTEAAAATAPFAAERVPAGTGWQCSGGHCSRTCMGRPGAEMADGAHSEPTCSRPAHAYCTTYTASKLAQWECFPERVSCEANQRHYASEAAKGVDFSLVSPCTEVD